TVETPTDDADDDDMINELEIRTRWSKILGTEPPGVEEPARRTGWLDDAVPRWEPNPEPSLTYWAELHKQGRASFPAAAWCDTCGRSAALGARGACTRHAAKRGTLDHTGDGVEDEA